MPAKQPRRLAGEGQRAGSVSEPQHQQAQQHGTNQREEGQAVTEGTARVKAGVSGSENAGVSTTGVASQPASHSNGSGEQTTFSVQVPAPQALTTASSTNGKTASNEQGNHDSDVTAAPNGTTSSSDPHRQSGMIAAPPPQSALAPAQATTATTAAATTTTPSTTLPTPFLTATTTSSSSAPRTFSVPLHALQSPRFRSMMVRKPSINSPNAAVWKGEGLALSIISPELSFVNMLPTGSSPSPFAMTPNMPSPATQNTTVTESGLASSSNHAGGAFVPPANAAAAMEANPFSQAFAAANQTSSNPVAPKAEQQQQQQQQRQRGNVGAVLAEANPFSSTFAAANAKRKGSASGAGSGSATNDSSAAGTGATCGAVRRSKRAKTATATATVKRGSSTAAGASSRTKRATARTRAAASQPAVAKGASGTATTMGSSSSLTRGRRGRKKASNSSGGHQQQTKQQREQDVITPPPLDETPEEQKKRIRREKNRIAAAACRQRKLQREQTLSLELEELKAVHQELAAECTELDSRLTKLKEVAIQHFQASCTGIDYKPTAAPSAASIVLPSSSSNNDRNANR